MPLTDDQKQALQTLAQADPKEVADALQKDAQTHFQTIYQRGFSTAHEAAKTQLEAKDAEITAEKARVQEKDGELATLREQTPDVEKVRTELEAKLQEKDREKQEAIDAANKRVEDLHASRFDAEFGGQLIALNIDPDYAREVLVPKYRNRRKVAPDGTVKFYDEDGATPLAAAEGELARVAAERVRKTVDAKWIKSGAGAGGGSQNGEGGAGGSGEWDKIRQSAKDRNAPAADSEAVLRRKAAMLPAG